MVKIMVKYKGVIRGTLALLLVFVMLSSVATVMAANANEKTCKSCSLKDKNAKVVVIEVKGLKKNEALAKALKNEDVKKLMDELTKKGHKPKLAKAIVNKIIGKYGEAVYVSIPFKAGKGYKEAGLVYVVTESGSKAFAVETYEKDRIKHSTVYYVDLNGNIAVLQVSTRSCLEECTVDCVLCCVCDNPNCGICGGAANTFCAINCIGCAVEKNPWMCAGCAVCSVCYLGCAIWCCL
jgi:hypothetical protein